MMSIIFAAKVGIIMGTSLTCGSLFGSMVKGGGLAKTIASYAGYATGIYLGTVTANELHHMLKKADEANKAKIEEEEEEVTVNG